MNINNQKKWLPWFMVFLGAAFYCYEYVLRLIPSVVVPELMESFNINAAQIGLISGAYYVGYVFSSGIVGPIYDRFLPRKVIILAIMACILGSGLFALAESLWLASFARFVIGFASAFGFIGVLKIGSMWVPKERFGAVAGLASFLGMLTAMTGQVKLSNLTAYLSWEQLSLNVGLSGFALLFLFIFFFRDAKQPALVTSKPVCSPWTFKKTFSSLMGLVHNKIFWMNGLIGCTTFLPITAFAELWGISYLEFAYDIPRQDAAFYNGLVFFGWACGGPFFGMLFDKTQNWGRTVLIGTLGALISILWILYMPCNRMTLPFLLFMFGFFGSSHVLAFISGRLLLPGQDGTALALTNFVIMMGGMIFQPLIGAALDLLARHTSLSITALYESAMCVIPLGLLLTVYFIIRIQSHVAAKQDQLEAFDGEQNLAY